MQDALKKPELVVDRPTHDEAEDAVRTLLAWSGDDPTREGLLDRNRWV